MCVYYLRARRGREQRREHGYFRVEVVARGSLSECAFARAPSARLKADSVNSVASDIGARSHPGVPSAMLRPSRASRRLCALPDRCREAFCPRWRAGAARADLQHCDLRGDGIAGAPIKAHHLCAGTPNRHRHLSLRCQLSQNHHRRAREHSQTIFQESAGVSHDVAVLDAVPGVPRGRAI